MFAEISIIKKIRAEATAGTINQAKDTLVTYIGRKQIVLEKKRQRRQNVQKEAKDNGNANQTRNSGSCRCTEERSILQSIAHTARVSSRLMCIDISI